MRGKQHRRKLKPIDEQAADVVCRIIDRPHDFVAAQLAEPIGGRVEQRVRDLLIVDRLEHPEAADIRLVERVVLRVVARHDPPDDFAAGPRQKKRGIAVLVKRMLFAIEELFPLEQQRRHPRRIVRIDPPREFDEGVAFRARSDLSDFDLAARRVDFSGSGPVCKTEMTLRQWIN